MGEPQGRGPADNTLAAISDTEERALLESLLRTSSFANEVAFCDAAERLVMQFTRARLGALLLDGIRGGEVDVALTDDGAFTYTLTERGRSEALDRQDWLDRRIQDVKAGGTHRTGAA